jgi:hypothetical protein
MRLLALQPRLCTAHIAAQAPWPCISSIAELACGRRSVLPSHRAKAVHCYKYMHAVHRQSRGRALLQVLWQLWQLVFWDSVVAIMVPVAPGAIEVNVFHAPSLRLQVSTAVLPRLD